MTAERVYGAGLSREKRARIDKERAARLRLREMLAQATAVTPVTAAEDLMQGINEAVGWDSRKTLADVWQERAPIANLSEATYDALIAVAQWGARSALENAAADAEPLQHITPTSDKSIRDRVEDLISDEAERRRTDDGIMPSVLAFHVADALAAAGLLAEERAPEPDHEHEVLGDMVMVDGERLGACFWPGCDAVRRSTGWDSLDWRP